MANLLQSSQTQATTTPQYYTDYLSSIAKSGQAAANPVTGAQFVDANSLQTSAFNNADKDTGTYTTQLGNAGTTLGNAGSATSPLSAATGYLTQATSNPAVAAQGYMNPYITSVVNALGEAGQRNVRQNLAPGAVAGAIGGGQFGSKRGAEVLGQTLTNANRDILNKQGEALSTGYGQALNAATTQNQIEGQAGATAANAASAGQTNLTNLGSAQSSLAGQDQALALARLNALSTLGAQKQTIAQNKELFPLQNLTTLSGLLRGYTTPTTTTTTAEMSPLSAIGAVGAGAAGLFTPNSAGATPWSGLTSALGSGASTVAGWFGAPIASKSSPTGFVNSTGQAVTSDGTIIGTDAGKIYQSDFATTGGDLADNTLVYNPSSPTGYADVGGNFVNSDGSDYTPP